MPAAHDRAQQFDFYKYLRIFWRRKWMLIIPLALCIPVSLLAAWRYPTEYQSRAILEMRHTAPEVEVGERKVNVGAELSSVRQRIFSWNAIRDIVLSRKVDFGSDIDPDDRRQLEKLYHKIMRRTGVRPLGRAHLEIRHISTDPVRNAALVNELAKKFTEEDRREAQDRAKVDVEYYREKYDGGKARLTELDNQLRDFAQTNPWLRDDLAELHRDLKDAEALEERVQQEIAEREAHLEEIKKALARAEPEITIVKEVEPSEEWQNAKKRLDNAGAYFKQVDDNYTRAHRRWRDAAKSLQEAEAAFKGLDKGDLTEEQTVDNPEYAKIQRAGFVAQKELEKANRRKLEVNKKVSELFLLNRKAPELLAEKKRLQDSRDAVQEAVTDLTRHYGAAEKKLARLSTEAYSTKFRVFEYARDDMTPVKSTKFKIIALGIMIGTLTGVGLVVLLEYLDQTFKTIDDAREVLGIPALGVIPAIFTPRDHRRRLWFRVFAVSSAVFVVGVAVTLYLAVPAVPEMLREQVWPAFQEMMQTF
ncbi:GumC family protein [Planctomycetota bacterium]